MATTSKSKKMVETMIDSQTKIVNEMAENAKKVTKDFPIVNETISKSQEKYNEAADAAKKMNENIHDKAEEAGEKMKNASEEAQNYFKQWLEAQMNMAKNMFSQTQQTHNPSNFQFPNNFNWMNYNQPNTMWGNWMNTSSNPFAGAGNSMNAWNDAAKNYFNMFNSNIGDWTKNFHNPTAGDAFKGMSNMMESFGKFYEMWMPMMKNIQDKNFNLDVFKDMMNPNAYKEFMDKFFHFTPDNIKQMFDSGMSQFNNMKTQMSANPFAAMWNGYNQMHNAFTDSVSPLTKLMADNANFKSMNSWNEIFELMMETNIKNSQLQYMVYQQGMKVMEKTAEKISSKIQNGESIDSLIKLFQEWLSTGDSVFTKLFESDEYSKLMTEVSSLQMKLKQKMDSQIEKMITSHMPVPVRSEMDEVYKLIYDLKKTVRDLERKMSAHEDENHNKTNSKKK